MHNADIAEVEVRVLVKIRVPYGGLAEVRISSALPGPVTLSRRWTADELADSPKLGGDEWFEGGAAILSPTHAANGPAMVRRATDVANNVVTSVVASMTAAARS